MLFTPDNPQDRSKTSRGSIRTYDGIERRSVRLKSRSAYPDAHAHFLAVHMAYSHIIEKHGPTIYGWDHIERCVYVEEIEGGNITRYISRDINPWTAEGARQLEQVVSNARNLFESLRQDSYTSPTDGLGYIVKPDLSVRQVKFDNIYYFRRPDWPFDDYLQFKQVLADALVDNVEWRMQGGNLSAIDFQVQMQNVPGMVNTLMP